MRQLLLAALVLLLGLATYSAIVARDIRQNLPTQKGAPMTIISKFTLRDPELDNAEDPVIEVSRTSGQEASAWLQVIAMQVATMPFCTTWQTRINGKLYDAKVTTICGDETASECETRHDSEVSALKQVYEEE